MKPRTSIYDKEFFFQNAAIALTAFLVCYPLFWLFLGSFRESIFKQSLTFKWYIKAFSDPFIYKVLINTFIFSGGGTLFAAAIGIVLAWIVARTNTPLRGTIRILSILPFVSAPFIGAVSWCLLAWPNQGLLNLFVRWLFQLDMEMGPFNVTSLSGMIWVQGIYQSPYVFLITAGALQAMDPSLEEAATVSGAGIIKTSFRVTLPMVKPAILSGVILSFVLGAGQFGVPAFLGIPSNIYVLTTLIFSKLNHWPIEREYASALAFMLLIITMGCVYLQRRLVGQREYTTIAGKGHRPRIIDLGRYKYLTMGICMIYLIIAIILPYGALLYASFVRYWSSDLSWALMTFKNYQFIFFEYPGTWISLGNSFLYSLGAATANLALCSVISYIILRTTRRGKKVLDYIAMLPASIPALVFGVGLLIAYLKPPLKLYGTMWILMIAYLTTLIPYGVRATSSSLVQVSKELEEAGRVCGAPWMTTFRKITMPLIKPGILAGWVLVFVTLMRELGSSILLYTPQTIVSSIVLWNLWDEGNFVAMSAFAVLITSISLAFIILVFRFVKTSISIA